MRIIEPPLSALEHLRTPLNRGEQKVLNFFVNNLSNDWEIYIQPHLNGLRPDFVLLNPKIGIAIFEVKGWNFNAMDYFIKNKNLYARDPHEEFSIEHNNPITKLRNYKQDLFELYCPRLGIQVAKTSKAYATITVGAIFPFASSAYVKNFFSQFYEPSEREYFGRYNLILGREDLEAENIADVFPEAVRKYSQFMKEELLYDLRGWLVEPEFSREGRKPLLLDENQRKFVEADNAPEYRRIKGCAGSGKTFVIAARAAKLAAEGKSVLICVFNITLINYIRDMVAIARRNKGDMDKITILHFHDLCRRVCVETGHKAEYDSFFPKRKPGDPYLPRVPDIVFAKKIPDLVQRILSGQAGEELEKYDALLVDEGQDFLPNWWEILRSLVKPGGEKLFVADAAQDIYERICKWKSEDLAKSGFRGPWNILYTSYRLPEKIIYIANFFVKKYFAKLEGLVFKKGQVNSQRQNEFESNKCQVKWVNCRAEEAENAIIASVKDMIQNTGLESKKSVADITILCDKIDIGLKVTKKLTTFGIKSLETFDTNWSESRSKKMGFYKGDARIKATTIHSFKGYESSMILLYVSDLLSEKEKYLFYVSLTRLKYTAEGSYMTIVYSGNEDYHDLADYINCYDVMALPKDAGQNQ